MTAKLGRVFAISAGFMLCIGALKAETLIEEDFSGWEPEVGNFGNWVAPHSFEGLRKAPAWPDGGEMVLDGSEVDVETTSHPTLRYFLHKEIKVPVLTKTLDLVLDFQWGHYASPMAFVGRVEGDSFTGFGFAFYREGSNEFTHAEIVQLDNAPIGIASPPPGTLLARGLFSNEDFSGVTISPVDVGQKVSLPIRKWIQATLTLKHLGNGNWSVSLESDHAEGPSIEIATAESELLDFGQINAVGLSVKAQGEQVMQVRQLLVESI